MNDFDCGSALDEAALDWAVRIADADAADWDGFMAWLEIDPANSQRYDRVVTALQDVAQSVEAAPAAASSAASAATPVQLLPLPLRASVRPKLWMASGVAAVLAGMLGFSLWREMPQPYVVESPTGRHRAITLLDGSVVLLAGASSIRLDHSNPRRATVLRGEALFHIHHDAANSFQVRVGDLKLVDLGTVFDIKISRYNTRVAVAEGAVMVDPDGAAVRLDPGQAVLSVGGRLRRQSVAALDVGGWRDGRLAFDNVPLEEVAEDLSRQLARPIAASPSLAGLLFRGTLTTDAIQNNPQLLGTLLGVDVRTNGSRWKLEPRR